MKNILIIGNGEIGKAVTQVEKESKNKIFVLDINDKQFSKKYKEYSKNYAFDICHVCIPYSEDFSYMIFEYIKDFDIELTIINSTVKPGTTLEIYEMLDGDCLIAHSPVRGIHPHLYEGLKTFVKYVGGTEEACELACDHFNSIGIDTKVVGTSRNSEFLKILCTTQYGYNILLAKMIKEMCDKHHLDFDDVYTDSNLTYNEGYTKLGMSNVVRPVLYAPEGNIGGHCVGNNFELLPDCILKYFCKYLNESDLDSASKLIGLIEGDFFQKVILEDSRKKDVSKSK